MTDTELRRLAESNIGIADVPIAPDVVIALLDRIKALEMERDAWKSRHDTLADVAKACIASSDREIEALRAHAAKGGE